jgi:hypothetical protein
MDDVPKKGLNLLPYTRQTASPSLSRVCALSLYYIRAPVENPLCVIFSKSLRFFDVFLSSAAQTVFQDSATLK